MFDVFLGFAFLASATMANKYALTVLSLSLMVGLRMLGAGLILIFYYRHKTHRLKFSYFKEDAFILVGIMLLTMLVPALFKAYALKYMSASKTSFFGSLDPFVTALYVFLFWNENLTAKKTIGIILGFSGTLILLVSRMPESEQHLMAWSIFSYPEIAAILAMAIGRLGWMFVQQLLRKERYTSAELNGLLMTMSGATAFIAPFLGAGIVYLLNSIPVIWYYVPAYSFADATHALQITYSPGTNMLWIILAVIYTIVVGNVIGYTMYSSFLKHHSATFVSLAGFSVPLYTYLFDALLGNAVSINFIYASAVTFLGLLIFYQDEINKINPGFKASFMRMKNIFIK